MDVYPRMTPKQRLPKKEGVKIELTKGQYAIIDDIDWELTKPFKWHTNISNGRFRAFTGSGKSRISLEKLLFPAPDGFVIWHIDRNTLNCRRGNLEHITRTDMRHRQKIFKKNKERIVGLHQRKSDGQWQVSLSHKGKKVFQKQYADRDEAIVSLERARLLYLV